MRVYRTTNWSLGTGRTVKSKTLVKTTSSLLKNMFSEIDKEITEEHYIRLQKERELILWRSQIRAA